MDSEDEEDDDIDDQMD